MSADLFSFKSEEQLRQAIAKLLVRIPGIHGVQITHGSQEYGKDIIFWSSGPLGENVLCACVIKNSRIGGSVDRSADARVVCIQAQQALDTAFIDSKGSEQFVRRAYVISPEPISQSAMNSIKGLLRERAGAIEFIPGERLFELVRTYWPDFLVEEFAALDHHLQQLAEQNLATDLREVSKSYGLPAPEQAEEIIYVPRKFFRTIKIFPDDLLVEPVPGVHRLQALWTDQSLSRIINFLSDLGQDLNHLYSWALFRDVPEAVGKLAENDLASLRSDLLNLSRSLKSALILAQGQSSIDKINLSKKEERKYKLELPGKIISTAEAIGSPIHRYLKPLREAVRASMQLMSMARDFDGDVLQTKVARTAAALTDCLAAAPAPLVEGDTSMEFVASEDDIQNSACSWFIVGPAGYGKTSFCRWRALVDAQRYRSGEAKIFPVYVPLSILARRDAKSYQDAFLRTAGRSALFPENLNKSFPAREARIRLYLDGLDEISDSTKRRQIAELARQAEADGIQIILTSRDYIYMPELQWLMRVVIGLLHEDAQRELVARVLHNVTLIDKFYEQLKDGALGELMGVPLLARLILLVFRQTGDLPESRTRLYSTFADLLNGGWDLAKGLLRPTRFGPAIKNFALCRLAGAAHKERKRHFNVSMLEESIKMVATALNEQDVILLRSELLRDGLLSRSGRTFYFSHLSFQEFLCASYYHGSPDRVGIEDALAAFLRGDDWWREVLNFYIGLSTNPPDLSRWLAVRLKPAPDANRAQEVWEAFRRTFPQFDLYLDV